MPLRYLLDQHLRAPLWDIVVRYNAKGIDVIDVERVGDPVDLPIGTQDPEILAWAEREQRVLVTEDKSTMAAHLAQHLASGRRSPGLFTVRPWIPLPQILDLLVVAAYASDPAEWTDGVTFIP